MHSGKVGGHTWTHSSISNKGRGAVTLTKDGCLQRVLFLQTQPFFTGLLTLLFSLFGQNPQVFSIFLSKQVSLIITEPFTSLFLPGEGTPGNSYKWMQANLHSTSFLDVTYVAKKKYNVPLIFVCPTLQHLCLHLLLYSVMWSDLTVNCGVD